MKEIKSNWIYGEVKITQWTIVNKSLVLGPDPKDLGFETGIDVVSKLRFDAAMKEIEGLKSALEDRDLMHDQYVGMIEADRLRVVAKLKSDLEIAAEALNSVVTKMENAGLGGSWLDEAKQALQKLRGANKQKDGE